MSCRNGVMVYIFDRARCDMGVVKRYFAPDGRTHMKWIGGAKSKRIAAIGAGLVCLWGLTMGCEREQYDPEAAAVEAEMETQRGSHQYSSRVDDGELMVGQEQDVRLAVLPKPDLKINLEFPWSVEFSEGDDLAFDQLQWDREAMDMSEERVAIPLTVTAASAGAHTIEGRANFSVCNDDRCYIFSDEALEFVVHAEE